MKKITSLLLVIMLLVSMLAVSAVDAGAMTSGNFTYEMYTEDSVYITGYTGGVTEKLTIPSKLGGYPVKAIGAEAFYYQEIYSVTIPEGIEAIGDYAFMNTAISTVKLPDSLVYLGFGSFATAYFKSYSVNSTNPNFTTRDGIIFSKDMTELEAYPVARDNTDYTIPSGVKSIGSGAFGYALNLEKVYNLSGVEHIGECAFMFSSITSVKIPATVKYVDSYAFAGCTQLQDVSADYGSWFISPDAFEESKWFTAQPDGIIYFGRVAYMYKGEAPSTITLKEDTLKINGKAFAEQPKVTKIIIPNKTEVIEYSAFDRCESLVSIEVAQDNRKFMTIDGMLFSKDKTKLCVCPAGKSGAVQIPDGTQYIETYAFEYCEKMTAVQIPDTVTTIEEGAFYGCSALTSITIPDSVEYAGAYLFHECASLEDVTIPEGSVLFCDYDFYGTAWLDAQPEGVVYLCKSAIGYIYNDEEPRDVVIEEGTLSIGREAFFGYPNIKSVTLPDSLKKIGDGAFAWCQPMTEITIPSSVEEIGLYALGYSYEYSEESGEWEYTPVEGFVIKGYSGTAAQTYAQLNNIEFESLGEYVVPGLLGDVDGDGRLSVRDATTIQKSLADIITLTEEQVALADFKADDTINVKDATAIQKCLVGLEY
ncbi:MAG: leucine-rich repeat protein [Ruminococcus sp.]|nr:leucine-rich repeat protein [Ruminococcus sp.]